MRKVIKDTPLLELTIRRYEKPAGMEPRELLKKFCLSIGLLQPGDSRDIIVDILHVLLVAGADKRDLASEEVRSEVVKLREELGLPLLGVASSNVRRQLKRLRDILVVEKVKNSYRITEFSRLDEIYQEKLEKYLLPTILSRVKEYFTAVDESFKPI